MGWTKTLKEFGDQLATLGVKVFRGEVLSAKPDFILWNETSAKTYHADNAGHIRLMLVDVDIFTKDDMPTLPDRAEALFDKVCAAWDDPVISYDSGFDTQVWSYKCEVLMR